MGTNQNQAGQGGGKTYLLAGFLALAVGAVAVYAFSSSSSEDTDGVKQESAIQADQKTPAATAEQNRPSDTAANGAAEAKTVQAGSEIGATVTLVATDDPFYLSCVEKPLAEGETREQRTAYCNQELQKLQVQQQPSSPSNGNQ